MSQELFGGFFVKCCLIVSCKRKWRVSVLQRENIHTIINLTLEEYNKQWQKHRCTASGLGWTTS